MVSKLLQCVKCYSIYFQVSLQKPVLFTVATPLPMGDMNSLTVWRSAAQVQIFLTLQSAAGKSHNIVPPISTKSYNEHVSKVKIVFIYIPFDFFFCLSTAVFLFSFLFYLAIFLLFFFSFLIHSSNPFCLLFLCFFLYDFCIFVFPFFPNCLRRMKTCFTV